MNERRYLPTVAELIDRLSIVLMKSIFIPENRMAYRDEMELIKHDIDLAIQTTDSGTAEYIYAILVLMLANRFIWENETLVRSSEGSVLDTDRLRWTHAVNGVRNTAKNKLAEYFGHRKDLKIDCLAADLPPEMGNWNVF